MTRAFRGALLLGSFASGLFAIAPASAQPLEKISREVRYGDLDLSNEAGLARFDRRLKQVSARLCGRADIRDLKAAQAAASCRDSVMADAAPKRELAITRARGGQDFAATTAIEVGKPVLR